MFRYIFIAFINLTLFSYILFSSEKSEAHGPITIDMAYKLVMKDNPKILGVEAEKEVVEGSIEQASYFSNPEVEVGFENAYGSGAYKGSDMMETTIGLTQLIELGNKRKYRAELALKQKDLLRWDYLLLQQELRYQVKAAFVAVLLAQESVELNKELLATVDESYAEIKKLNESSSVSKVDLVRARLELKQQKFSLLKAERAVIREKTALASLWGNPENIGFSASGTFVLEKSIPKKELLFARLLESPGVLRYRAETEMRESELEVAKADAVQDVSMFAGYRRFKENSDHSFLAGFEIPIPIFNRNRGNIRTARARVHSSAMAQLDAQRESSASFAMRYEELSLAHSEAEVLKKELIPAAVEVFNETKIGYEQGLFSYLNALDARTSLIDLRREFLDSVTRYYLALAKIEQLTQSEIL